MASKTNSSTADSTANSGKAVTTIDCGAAISKSNSGARNSTIFSGAAISTTDSGAAVMTTTNSKEIAKNLRKTAISVKLAFNILLNTKLALADGSNFNLGLAAILAAVSKFSRSQLERKFLTRGLREA